jgi:PAS domain S-box-containing protein
MPETAPQPHPTDTVDPAAADHTGREGDILRAVAQAAQRLLGDPSWEDAIDDVLSGLGKAAGVSRVWLAVTHLDDSGITHGGLTHEWTAPGVPARLSDPGWLHYAYDEPSAVRWADLLGSGRPVVGNVADFPAAERADLEPMGVRSILVSPMIAGGDWLGHVGFDECRTERDWSPAEVDALMAATGTLGAAIARGRAETEARAAEERYRTLVEQLPAVTHVSALDPSSSTIYISPQVEDLLGYEPREWLEDPDLWVKVLHPEDRERMIADNLEHIHSGTGSVTEYRMIARDGHVVWVYEDVTVIAGADGTPRFSHGLWLNITARKRAQETLRETEARYQTLVEQVPAVTYTDIVAEDDRMGYVSPQVEALIGYTSEEWEADPDLWMRVVHPDDLDRVIAIDEECIRTGEPYAVDYRFVARDGRVVWVHDEAVLIPSPPGEPQLWQGIIVDVTDRLKADEALRFQAQLMEAVQDAVIATDAAGLITYWNGRAEELFGWEATEVTGRDVREVLWQRSETSPFADISQTLRENQDWVGEFDLLRRGGAKMTVRASVSPVRGADARVRGAIAVMMDVTERRRAEESLRTAFDREREITRQLRAVDEMKNTFLQAVSHELRTPLSAVLGFALTLEREEVRLEPDESREIVHRLAVNARKLERLLSDLLDLDRLGRGIIAPRRRTIDVGRLAETVVDGMDISDEHRVTVEAPPSQCDVDPAKVERIIENLVSNAVRHTPAGTAIWVRVSQQEGGVLLEVADNGPGVPEDMREAIFEPFRQAPGLRPHSPGVGMGLTLVARFAELHGGKAWVEPREGGGASFRVFLPGA